MAQPVRLVLIVATLAAFAAACGKDSPTSPSEQAQLAVTPNAGAQGSAVPITITGTNFAVGSVFEGTLSGGGVAVSRITVLDPATAVATVTIGPDAALGARTFTFTAPSGATFSAPFTITVPVPTLTAIGPSAAVSGTSAIFTLSGAAFGTGTTVAVSGAGVTVSEVNVNDSTILTARFTVDAAADLGPRTVTVTTPSGSATQTFNIVPPAPVLTALTPASGVNGTTVNVTLSGSNFVPGATTVNVSGSGVTTQIVSGPQVTASGRSMVVAFIIDANAAQGSRSVTVSTSGGTSAALTFNVGSATGFPTIGSFTATPATIVPGGSSTLRWSGVTNATSCSINNGIGDVTCADGAVGVSPTSTTEYQFMATGPGGREWIYALVLVEPSGSQTFDFTGAAQTFTVPNGVTQLTVNAFGAQGGAGAGGPAGALGGSVSARIAVTPGETLTITVGGAGVAAGAGGFNGGGDSGAAASRGGGGGGASDVRQGGAGLANRVVVAGGGGGSGTLGTGGAGGAGGGLVGAGGANGLGGAGGGGGTAAAGGAGGTGNAGADGSIGASGQGGAGGGGAESGGGAGGGLFGGGGGEEGAGASSGGGGGGSSFTIAGAASVTHAQGVRAGNGQVIVTW